MIVCGYCLENIHARGEKVTIIETIYADEADDGNFYADEIDGPAVCEWCEEGDAELYRIEWR